MNDVPAAKGPRCFVAVPLPVSLRESLCATIAPLAAELPQVRWQRKIENLHLTLNFLGNIPDDHALLFAAALPGLLADIPPFAIQVRGLGGFPSARHANVLWAGVDDTAGTLARIAARLETQWSQWNGARPEAGRPFRPHVTLGRAKVPVDARAAVAHLANLAVGGLTVAEIHFYESRLARAGATYTLRARGVLGGI
jgi:RNA 2',3'-cyclic 3'-phosphodiesterase